MRARALRWWNSQFLGRAAIVSLVLTFAATALTSHAAGATPATIVAVVGIIVTAALARAWGFTRGEQRS